MYIKFMIEENKNKYVTYWLLLITFLVCLMILVGGLTRLTDSGLSITKWDLFAGIFPPINLKEWNYAFSLYKQIPEYTLVNPTMTLNEFKIIYWWEYIHRLLGRVVGILYLLPMIYFSYKKTLPKKVSLSIYLIFCLICIQGFVGWYMVKSGLSDRTDVSHYRLSTHLTMAFVILILLVWNYLKILYPLNISKEKKLPFYLPVFLVFFILVQISLGALVSGLDGAQIYQTWPLMGENYFPNDSRLTDLLNIQLFDSPSILQFIHRNLAYFIFFIFLTISFLILKNKSYDYLKRNLLLIFIALFLQIFLGILTILSGAQIFLASMHQIGSIFLIILSTMLAYKNSAKS